MRHVILLPFIMIMIMAGCAAVGPDHTMDLDAKELERQDGLKNLATIREIMASWPRQQDQPASPTSKPDEYHGNDSPWVIPQVYETDKPVEPLSLFAIPKQEPVQPQPLQIRPPLRSQNYTDSRLLNPPLIPPYTFYAPIGSAYPGSIRCMPDYLGGSRCSVHP
jgi:hypothetical protein